MEGNEKLMISMQEPFKLMGTAQILNELKINQLNHN